MTRQDDAKKIYICLVVGPGNYVVAYHILTSEKKAKEWRRWIARDLDEGKEARVIEGYLWD